MTSWLLMIWSPDFCQPHFNQFFPSLMLHNALLSSTGYSTSLPRLKAFHLWFPFYLWSIFSFLVKLTFIMPAQMALSWVVVQLPSCVWLFASHGRQHNKPLCPLTVSKFMSTASVMPSCGLILCHPLLLLASIFPTIRVFSNDSAVCKNWETFPNWIAGP